MPVIQRQGVDSGKISLASEVEDGTSVRRKTRKFSCETLVGGADEKGDGDSLTLSSEVQIETSPL